MIKVEKKRKCNNYRIKGRYVYADGRISVRATYAVPDARYEY